MYQIGEMSTMTITYIFNFASSMANFLAETVGNHARFFQEEMMRYAGAGEL